MMVAVGLFAFVMLISTAVIFSIVDGNRKSQQINSVVNNLNFSIESIIRDIKTGYWYQCYDYHGTGSWPDLATFKQNYQNQKSSGNVSLGYSCDNVSQPITFISFISTISGSARVVEYYYVPAYGTEPGKIWKTYHDETNAEINSPLTTPDIDIQQVDFYIKNAPPADLVADKLTATQPSAFVIIKGNTKIGDKTLTTFGIQTYISQRLFNI